MKLMPSQELYNMYDDGLLVYLIDHVLQRLSKGKGKECIRAFWSTK